MNGRLPTPPTAREVELFIESIGGLCQWKPLCPPFRGEAYDDGEETPLITDEIELWWDSEDNEDWCEERKQVEAWLAARGL